MIFSNCDDSCFIIQVDSLVAIFLLEQGSLTLLGSVGGCATELHKPGSLHLFFDNYLFHELL